MKNFTNTHFLTWSVLLFLASFTQAQETTKETKNRIPIEGDQVTAPRNNFIDYNSYILDKEDFKFRREIKRVKHDADFLEYASTENSIRISKYDYLRLVRRAVNQSDSQDEFITKMIGYFPDTENEFTNTLNLETIYDSTRPKTFYGRFDGLPRLR